MVPPRAAEEDYYAALGVDSSACPEDISRAYKRQALLLHPDKSQDKKASTTAFLRIQEAYETLRDPVRRLLYNELRQGGPGQASGYSGGYTCSASGAASPPVPGAEAPAEAADDRPSGGLAVGACLCTAAASAVCGVPAALGLVFCGVSSLFPKGEEGRGGRCTVTALAVIGAIVWWGSSVAWTVGLYASAAFGLGVLASDRERLPDFVPYLLFAGYLLLYLLAPASPVTPSTHVDIYRLPGYVVLEQGVAGEEAPDFALPESVAIFTWGVVAVHWVVTQSRARKSCVAAAEAV